MRIAVIGAGYVGLVSAACFAKAGHRVFCADIDASRIALLERGETPIYEPGLNTILADRSVRKRLVFCSNAAMAAANSEITFLAVGTPPRASDGAADLSQVFAVVESISGSLRPGAIVATKSTVPVGTGDDIEDMLHELRPNLDVEVASNPEFLRAGCAVDDFIRPDRVVVGAEGGRAAATLTELYRSVGIDRGRILVTDRRSSELIKYAANGFLATKIAFINEVATLCEKLNASIGDVAAGIGLDRRIGMHCLQSGPGFGGSCFPKDARALARMGEDNDAPMRIIETVLASNEARKRAMARKMRTLCGGRLRGKTVALLGLTFKADTDDVRDAVSVPLAHALVDAGSAVRAYDPVANERARAVLPSSVRYCGSAMEAAENVDLIVIATEWPEFKRLDVKRLRAKVRTPVVADLRNLLSPEDFRSNGFRYIGIGGRRKTSDEAMSALIEPAAPSWSASRRKPARDEEPRITAAE
jgi:UDPglucose 6-dehydrogenase